MYQKQDILCSVQKRKKRNLDDFYIKIDRFIDNLETKSFKFFGNPITYFGQS